MSQWNMMEHWLAGNRETEAETGLPYMADAESDSAMKILKG